MINHTDSWILDEGLFFAEGDAGKKAGRQGSAQAHRGSGAEPPEAGQFMKISKNIFYEICRKCLICAYFITENVKNLGRPFRAFGGKTMAWGNYEKTLRFLMKIQSKIAFVSVFGSI